MPRYGPFVRFAGLISLIIVGLILTAGVYYAILIGRGYSLEEIQALSGSGQINLPAGSTRVLLLAQHLLVFIIPGILYASIFFRSDSWHSLGLSRVPRLVTALFGIGILLASIPLVNLSFKANELIPLPDWASDLESQAEQTLRAILDMHNPFLFLINLLIIAILPGIGEEIIFRGIIQKEFSRITRLPVFSIWMSGFVFSLIHMQFEGFFPRMVLGVVLGYLYYWTRNLWIPIIAHAFNNGIQVAMIYFAGMDLSEVDKQGTGELTWWMICLSVIGMFVLYLQLIKTRTTLAED